MSLKIDIPQNELLKPKITIFGVGGAGGNAINNMIRSNLEGVEFVAANTDAQALQHSLAQNHIQLGLKTTRGLGAGSFPDRGRAAAEENLDEIEKYLDGNNMVFIAAGMGGGTGTGAAPVIAKLARERDILTVGVVTKPFHFEGKYRMETAEAGIDELKKYVDTLIVIPNQNLFRIANEQTTFESAFKMADDVLHAGVRGVTDLITMPGLVNLDFADIRTIMTKMGKAMMGTGEAAGENRAILACEAAISNPLLDDISIKGAKGVLVNMTGGPDMTLFEADMAVNAIKKEVDANANIIFGSAFNENMKGKIRISVVATGIDEEEFRRDVLKTPENIEPSRFKLSFGDSKETTKVAVKNDEELVKTSGKKTFFDPGVVNQVEDEIEEISPNNFKPKKSFLKEANKDYGKEEKKSPVMAEISEEIEELEQESFEENEFALTEQDDSETEVVKKSAAKSEPKFAKSLRKKPAPKKEGSGFSLFSFMNSSSKVSDEDNFEEIVEEAPKEIAKKLPKKSFSQNIIEDESSDLIDDQDDEVKPAKSSRSIDNKRSSFFSSTILDEDEDLIKNEEKSDDDILNVPAFFRRKK